MMNNKPELSVPLAEPFPSVTAAVAALTQSQLNRLLAISRRRIERLSQSPATQRLLGICEPADFVHDAIMLVLLGEIEPKSGRHTNRRHLASSWAFFNFLQGIVHSRIYAHLGKTMREGEHVTTNETSLPGRQTVDEEVQCREMKAAIAARLQAAGGENPAIQSTLLLLGLESDAAGKSSTRYQMHQVRKLGREALRELSECAQVDAAVQPISKPHC